MDVTLLSTLDLLRAHSSILDELRCREIVRSANNPISDLAEVLFCRAFKWSRATASAAGYDATDASGLRYQIKARRLSANSGRRQLSAIRKLHDDPFDYLAAVLLGGEFDVVRAALVPLAVVKARSRRSAHTNSWILHMREDVWSLPDVTDVTCALRKASLSL